MTAKTAPDTLQGQIERITYRNEETHFVIARFRCASQTGLLTVLGHLPEIKMGETLRLKGSWQDHPRFGPQFKIDSFEILLPSDADEIRRYLSSGLVRGIGARTADLLIDHFGDQALAVIENEPGRLTEVRGIGPVTAQKISESWKEHHAVRTLMGFLQTCGVKSAYGARLFNQYGVESVSVLKNDPYRVAAELPRVGFYIADAVDRHLGGARDPVERAGACLRHLLESDSDDGHMYSGLDQLAERCGTLFNLDYHDVREALDQLVQAFEIKIDLQGPDRPVYLYAHHEAEIAIVRRVQAMHMIPPPDRGADADQIMETVVRRLAIVLSSVQLTVLEQALEKRLLIITGGPGTGKTTLIRAITAVFDAIGRDSLLTAPTGRAARRMAEVSGRPAVTLHKLLGFNLTESRFERDQDNPLDTRAVIVDEASMLDVVSMAGLLKAMPLASQLILVGDVHQLPSVGPGTVLADLIHAGLFETFELKDVFRQDAQSAIIDYAHKVRRGAPLELEPVRLGGPLTGFTFIEEPAPEKIPDLIIALCKTEIPRQLGLNGRGDVQVLTPMHKGHAGALHLNQALQKALNPARQGLQAIGGLFKLGDKVMHLRNNYRKEVFNGEIGVVVAVNSDEKRLRVAFDGREVDYEDADLDELTLAYAITVHKAQGSEYPVIILALVTQHYIMLQRNLLYTALTRARRMVIVIGSPKAVRIAVQADKPRRRRSLLGWRLNPDCEPGLQ